MAAVVRGAHRRALRIFGRVVRARPRQAQPEALDAVARIVRVITVWPAIAAAAEACTARAGSTYQLKKRATQLRCPLAARPSAAGRASRLGAWSERHVVRAGRRRRSGSGTGLAIRRTVTFGGLGLCRWDRTGALEQDLARSDHNSLAPLLLMVGPFPPIELEVDHDARALAETLGAQACLRAVDLTVT